MKKINLLVLGLAAHIVGLFRGNMAGQSMILANEKTSRSADHWKRKTAMAIGKPEMADSSDEDLEASHDAHMQAAYKMANDGDDDPAAMPNAAPAPEPETPAPDAALKATEVKLANALISTALVEGRILPADKDTWLGKFANNFTETEPLLAAETKKIKTKPLTEGRGADNGAALANEAARSEKVEALVAEKLANNKGMDRIDAFMAIERENPALFDAMVKPESKK